MSNITNKFVNKVMEAIVIRNRDGYLPGSNVTSMTVGGKGKSVGGQRPEPTATTNSPTQGRVPVQIGDAGTPTGAKRDELARRVRITRPGNRGNRRPGEEGVRSNITRET